MRIKLYKILSLFFVIGMIVIIDPSGIDAQGELTAEDDENKKTKQKKLKSLVEAERLNQQLEEFKKMIIDIEKEKTKNTREKI